MKYLFTVAFILCSFLVPAKAQQPNIVFFFTDDQTTSTLGCYGNNVVKTPNIDGLASRGTRFSNAFVSHSICWVSRTTILTGLTGRGYGTSGAPVLKNLKLFIWKVTCLIYQKQKIYFMQL